jgi:CheY-like chemotaxis protein
MREIVAMHVLIVEDDPAIREMLVAVLEDEGYHVATAEHGQAALDYLARTAERPRAILLDLMMPTMNGWQFREVQRRTPGIADIPVIVLSAIARLDDERVQLDVAATITKPVDIPTLLETIEPYA